MGYSTCLMPPKVLKFFGYMWIIVGVIFVLGLNRNNEDLRGAGLLSILVGGVFVFFNKEKKRRSIS